MVHSRIFGILLKSIMSMIPKHDLTLVIFSPINNSKKIIEVRKQLFRGSKNS
jgi:hypothetical protein